MNKKGQALVEFVIILPVFIFMLLAVIDVGKIIYYKNALESELSDSIDMYNSYKEVKEIKKNINKDIPGAKITIEENDKYIEFTIKKEVEIITPGLNLIFGNKYNTEVKRVIYNE